MMDDPRRTRHPVHRLYDLYQRASVRDGSKALTIDPWSLGYIRAHRDAMQLFDHRDDGFRIMGMPVTVATCLPDPDPLVGSAEVPSPDESSIIRHPFGMYITLTKHNGRVSYVDDPDTDKAYQ